MRNRGQKISRLGRVLIFAWALACGNASFAACGATTYTWQPNNGNSTWNLSNNWTPTTGLGYPSTNATNAYIQSDWFNPTYPAANYTLACLEIASGSMTGPAAAQTLTISGDYFKNVNSGSLSGVGNLTIVMAGAAAQIFNNVDPIANLTISNSTTTTLPSAFTVNGTFTVSAGTGSILVQKGLTLASTSSVTIPASATLEVQSGATLVALGGLTVNGTLKVDAGASLLIGNGKTLSVPSGGVLQIIGTSGNVATLGADQGGSTYTVSIAGSLNANYFSVSRTTSAGLNVTGTVQALSNGDFHYIASSGYGVTLATAVNIPTPNPTGLAFYDDFAYGNVKNFNATSYTGTAFTVSNWNGLGGATYETDPSNKVNWGSQAAVALQLSNRTASGNPASTIAKGSSATLFSTFAFSLTGAGTSSDITSITFTLAGANNSSDVAYAQVMNDTNGNCAYDAGTDLQIGSNIVFQGSPPTATISIPSSTISVSGLTNKCVHVLLATSANAVTGDTLQVKIAGTTDVVNSQGYSFSNSAGPPAQGTVSSISGLPIKKWNGGYGPVGSGQPAKWNDTSSTTGANWTPTGLPVSTDDCQVGPAYDYMQISSALACVNYIMPDSGWSTWAGASTALTISGALTLGATYNFSHLLTISNASPGVMTTSSVAGGAPSTAAAAHGYVAGTKVIFKTTGTLPSPLAAGTAYYVAAVPAPSGYTFSVAATVGGTAINTTTAGSGTHYVTPYNGNLTFASSTTNQSIQGQTAFPGSVVINNTFGGGVVSVDTDFTVENDITLTSGTLSIAPGRTLTVKGNVTVNGGTLKISPGSTLTLGDGKTLTVNASGTLQIVGTSSQNANFTCSGTTTGCAVVINGTIKANYYSFSKLAVAGVTINLGATIDPTSYMQNGSFTYPVGTNPVLLTLNRQIPGNALGSMTFDSAGSPATGVKSIVTSASAGTLAVSSYSGDLTNCCTTAPTYVVSWTAPTTTLKLTREDLAGTVTISIASPGVITWNAHGLNAGAAVSFATTGALPTGLTAATTYYVAVAPAPTANTFSVAATSGGAAINTTGTQSGVHTISAPVNNTNQGDTAVRAGWFGFQQTQAGSYANTNLTSVKITLGGSGSSSDVAAARLYYDSTCTGTGGTQVGISQVFTGSPPTATFSGLSGVTVQSSVTSPPKRCVYVEFDVASTATTAATLIAQIASNSDVVNSQAYSFNGSYSPPQSDRTLTVIGSTITWTGTTSTAWNTPTNWSPNTTVPTSLLNCVINSATNNPIISAAGAVCKSLTIGNGTLTINTGQNLDVYGSITNTGTITQASATATVTVRDNGSVASNQTLQSSTPLDYLVFNKTAGGYVYIGNQNLTINHFTIAAGKTFTFNVRNGDTLTLPNGATMSSSTMLIDSGATVAITSGQTFTVSGATLRIAGTNDGYPQLTTNKGIMTRSGTSGTWSFVATSGTLDFTGWILDYLDCNGMQVGGTTSITNLNGGQMADLPPAGSCGSTLKAIQLNTTGTIPANFDYVGFNWGSSNTPPTPSTAYYLIYSSGCANQSVSLTNWFGDFFYAVDQPVVQTKISNTNCNATATAAASPVVLTDFKAIPYDSAVLVDWTTGLEILHAGFNVYRSLTPDSGAVQLNPAVLRNPLATGTVHGRYQFYDRTVANDFTYYYWVEDISTTGKRTMHGPLVASPLALLGAPPAPQSNAITGSQAGTLPSTPTPPSFSPGQTVLAPGVTVIARTDHSLRIRVDVPALGRTAGTSPYEHVALAGYAVVGEAGQPEVLENTIYVDIPGAASVTFTEVSRVAQSVSPINISANPAWVVTNGVLGPVPAFDAAFYSTNQSTPGAAITLGAVVQNAGAFSLPVTVTPVSFNPVTHSAQVLSQIVFDLSLSDVPSWNIGGAVQESGPYGYEGALKIKISKSGMYQLAYSDLVSAGVDAPFSGANATKLRLFRGTQEIPLQVHSAGSFGSGDWIRFFSPFFESPYSSQNTLVLIVDQVSGLRMDSLPGTPAGVATTQLSFSKRAQLKNPRFGFFGEPYGENVDHILWGRFFAPPTSPGDDSISTSVKLPNLVNVGSVVVKVYVKGSPGPIVKNPVHHLRLRVNGVVVGDDEFQSNDPYVSVFSVPANRFVPTQNAIEIVAVGDHAGSGDYDINTLDRFVIDYPHDWRVDNDTASVENYRAGSDLTLDGFSAADIHVFDVTKPTLAAEVTGLNVVANGSGGYTAGFGTVGNDPSLGRRFWAVTSAAMLLPESIELNPGSNLVSTTHGADVLYIGPKNLLNAIGELVLYRQDQGYRTAVVDVEKIYMEFGSGDRSPQAIRNFIKYTVAHWQAPAPQYVVLVGDGTFDPKNQLNYNPNPSVPIYLSKGQFLDYANDNWFVALDDASDAPKLAIGRIPGNSPTLIRGYAHKVISYESGETRPQGDAANQMLLINDIDQIGGENFKGRADLLTAQIKAWNPLVQVSRLSRDTLSDGDMKLRFVAALNAGTAVVHYLGHGAEDRWASASFFQNTDVDTLTNGKLPIVIAMNCLNAYFYDADPAYKSLAEKLIFSSNGGAIAFWGSTSLTSPDLQAPFQNALYKTLAQSSPILLGDAIRLAKNSAGASSGNAEIVRSWTLIGDPMVKVTLPSPSAPTLAKPVLPSAVGDASPTPGGSCASVHQLGRNAELPGWGTLVNLLVLALGLLGGRRLTRKFSR